MSKILKKIFHCIICGGIVFGLIFAFSAIIPGTHADTDSNGQAIVKQVAKTPHVDTFTHYYSALPLSKELQEYTYDLCVKYDIKEQYEVILAIMWTESHFNPETISATHDYGIMQINQCNHKNLRTKLNVSDFLDARQNILCGVYMFSHYVHNHSNIHEALMAYNYGPNGAKKYWARGIHTSAYSRLIMKRVDLIKQNKYC